MLKDLHYETSSSSVDTGNISGSSFGFRDNLYLLAVISHLREVRLSKSIEIQRLSRRAAIKKDIIHRAETDNAVPNSAQLKAWAGALGIQWEDLWSNALVSKTTQYSAQNVVVC